MNRAHKLAEDRYETIRVEAREDAMASLPSVLTNHQGQAINIRGEVLLTGIDFRSCMHATAWESSPHRRPDIEMFWPVIVNRYARTVPKRFELSIWHRGSKLCGLALGQPTWSGSKLRLDLIEASPDRTPLKGVITDITVFASIMYSRAIGATQLRIMSPINERVRNHYLNNKLGFSYNKNGNFCYRDI